MRAIKFRNNRLFYLDQTCLPVREVWQECRSLSDAVEAIRQLKVRGAPMIGVFAAYSLYIAVRDRRDESPASLLKYFDKACTALIKSRPTAVNLAWAVERVREAAKSCRKEKVKKVISTVISEAKAIDHQDVKLCAAIGKYGLKLIRSGDVLLTHCNAGLLATAGNGTALAVIYEAARKFKNIRVYADETRPLLQGARLTCWELMKNKVGVTLICDNMAADLMRRGLIDKIIVGADRITAQGDVANKIGTYGLAVNAFYHKVPFYVAAPFSTFDLTIDKGEDIPIEQRSAGEVRRILGKLAVAPREVPVYNPAFDVTPHKLITAIITDRGIIRPPFSKNIKRIFSNKKSDI